MNNFSLYTALITPFTDDNLVDFEALRKLTLRLIEQGCEGFVVLGTTAEATSLSVDERVMILRLMRSLIPTSIPMIVGVGTTNIVDTIHYCGMAKELGADAVLLVTPYYVCPNQEGLFAFFDYVATYCTLPIYLYNVKRRCGVELECKTIDNLLEKHSSIVGLKQAGGEYKEFLPLKQKYPLFRLFGGDDGRLEEALNLNYDGIISVIGNARFDVLKRSALDEMSMDLWNEMCTFFYKEPTPSPTKYIVSKQGIGKDNVRLPLCRVSDDLKEKLDKYVN